MRVCIVGAGAIGGFIGTRLATAGRAEVSAVARGATLNALREQSGAGDPLVRAFCSAAMLEAAAIGDGVGCRVAQSPEDRHAVTAKLGALLGLTRLFGRVHGLYPQTN